MKIGHITIKKSKIIELWEKVMFSLKSSWGICFFLFLFSFHIAASNVWLVDWESTATLKDGMSWDAAFDRIQDGVDAAGAAGGGEVWVAEGTYKDTTAIYMAEIVLKQGVHLYGGFRGIGPGGYESRREQRDWNIHKTVISGDFSKRCVNGASHATLDGFDLIEGRSKDDGVGGHSYGAGIGCWNIDSFVIHNCFINSNNALGAHGQNENPVYPFDPKPTPGGNAYGGGIYLKNSNVDVTNSIISSCQAIGGAGGSGFMYLPAKGGDAYGGAVYADSTSTLTLMNCVIYGNLTLGGKGGVIGGMDGSAYSTVFVSESSRITNSIIYYNGDIPICPANASVAYCDVEGGFAGEGNISANPMFAGDSNNDFRLLYGSPCIDTGTSETAPLFDLDGKPRPVDVPDLGADGTGTEFDMGAYEYLFDALRSLELLNHILGRVLLPDNYRQNADINRDGKVDVADVIILQLQEIMDSE